MLFAEPACVPDEALYTPRYLALLCAIAGCGAHVLATLLMVCIYRLVASASAWFLADDPSSDINFYVPFAMYFCLFFYAQTAGLAGYVSGLCYKRLGGQRRVRPCLSLRFQPCSYNLLLEATIQLTCSCHRH
jgi:hypothetical protein